MTSRSKLALAAAAASLVLAVSGCAASPVPAESTADAASGDWPRTIVHEAGTTEIPAQPENIVSTSLTLTGTLLAIEAPLTATATTTVSDVTDENGFFSQWADVATAAGVEELYPNLEFDEEAVIAAAPDLIVVSSSGADSTADQYEKLSAIAPTIVLNYGDTTWQELAAILGEATGHEDEADAVVADFDARTAEVAAAITVPEGTANAIVWNGTENPTAFAKEGSAHADLLESLGFTIEGAPDELDTSEQARQDFAFLAIENVTTALTGSTVFLVNGGDVAESDLLTTPVLATAPAIVSGQVYPLGPTSFRIDYYSASQIVDYIESTFA
ncbi:Fe2+-enterobactin ABC transporter substrate-binding protein [Microbacterium allomyrinae]|uniref:Fe2+-enterobactin ABC transporter substrate-binding protein n=1 Tax=Microbacterium allomyrinae TaxID=2830666 RepID=A0A9X1S315_9MICO|nr:Fe2+-enterobactin ABC transporter substrate-binding protein [Microbacterium allomyrinae]MCC2031528.1 Fe2+-enterobactin ABC transporter substrate-binding protein [Microbacterium allomyrinae]